MPNVRNLMNGATKPQTASTVPPVVRTPEPDTSSNLPAVPQALNRFLAVPTKTVPMQQMSNVPYVATCEFNSGNVDTLAEIGIQPGDMYLMNNGEITKLEPFNHHVLDIAQFWTTMSDSGEVVKVYKVDPGEGRNAQEHIVALHLVRVGDELVPAMSKFRSGKVSAATVVINAVAASAEPKWAGKSDAHRIAAACPVPAGRVVGVVRTNLRTSKRNGNKYFVANTSVRPATIAEITLLGESWADVNFVERVNAATLAFDDEVEALAGRAV